MSHLPEVPATARCTRRRLLTCAGAVAIGAPAAWHSGPAWAQPAFPNRVITVVSPFPAGGLNDTCARMVARALQDVLDKPAIVENRPGAGTMIALDHVARSAPDGHTLVVCSDTNMAVMPHLASGLQFSLSQDFAPITLLAVTPTVLVVRPGLKAASLAELVALAKAQPGKLSFGSSGNATPPHMIGEQFRQRAGIDAVHVAFKGAAPALLALMGDHVDFMFIDLASASAQIKAGKVRALAVSTEQRARMLPDVPTVAELGYPGFNSRGWVGLSTRAGTPAAVIETLNRAVLQGTRKPEIGGVLASQGSELTTTSAQQFGAMIEEERARAGQIIRSANIRLEG